MKRRQHGIERLRRIILTLAKVENKHDTRSEYLCFLVCFRPVRARWINDDDKNHSSYWMPINQCVFDVDEESVDRKDLTGRCELYFIL